MSLRWPKLYTFIFIPFVSILSLFYQCRTKFTQFQKNIFRFNDYFENISECNLDLDKNSPEMKTNILSDLLQLGTNEDLSPYTRLAVEEENELSSESSENFGASSNNNSTATQLAGFKNTPKIRPPSLSEISFSDGPSKEPEEGNLRRKKRKPYLHNGFK